MTHAEVQIAISGKVHHPKFRPPAILILSLLLCLSLLLASCESYQSKSYSGRLLLLYTGDEFTRTTRFSPGIYELKQDEKSPKLLWGNLPVELSDVYPIISPDGSLALLRAVPPSGDYLLNLQTGEGHLFYKLPYRIVFSPDNHFLAYATGGSLVVINLHNIDLNEMDKAMREASYEGLHILEEHSYTLVTGRGTVGSNCSVSLPVDYPIWADNETLVVAMDTRNIDPNFQFPEGTPCGTEGNLDMFTVVRVDGTVVAQVPAIYRLDFAMEYFDPNLAGAAILTRDSMQELDGGYPLSWLDTSAIAEDSKIIRNEIGYVTLDGFSIAPNGRTMLRFDKQWELYDLKTGEVTLLQKYPQVDKLSNCVWSPGGESVACLGLVSGYEQLFLLPISGGKPMKLYTWNYGALNSGWYMLAWQP